MHGCDFTSINEIGLSIFVVVLTIPRFQEVNKCIAFLDCGIVATVINVFEKPFSFFVQQMMRDSPQDHRQ